MNAIRIATTGAAISLLVIALFVPATTAAIIIDSGPTYTPPGFGSVTAVGTGPSYAGGITYDFTGLDLSQTANLYYGIKNDLHLTGYSMDGLGISASEIFRFSSAAGNLITYTGSTDVTYVDDFYFWQTYTSPTRLTMTLLGLGAIVQDATTVGLSNPNGDVGALWHVLGDFQATFLIEATVPPGVSNAGNYEPGNVLFDRLHTSDGVSVGTSLDAGFYYQVIPEPVSIVLFALGVLGSVVLVRRF